VAVPTYATSATMPSGSRRSKVTFHCWMVARSTLVGFGEFTTTPAGTLTLPDW
jgi:hypothetical protein